MNAVHGQEIIAFHEAAHATLFHCFNIPVESVEAGQDTGCCVRPDEWSLKLSDDGIGKLVRREALFRLIIASCAGKAAMNIWYGYAAKSDENWKASEDYKQALFYTLEINKGDREGAELLLDWLARRAEVIVKRRWPQIHKLAFALLDREKLSGAQIDEILIKPNKQLR
jgi:hypothetical protein